MTTQTKTGSYLKRMANGGHFKQKLGEAALALTECYCKADEKSRRELGSNLADQLFVVLHEVYGWDQKSCDKARDEVVKALHDTDLMRTVQGRRG